MGIRIEGLDKLEARLKKSGVNAAKELAGGLKVEAERIMTAAKRITPVDQGTLRSSGHVKKPVISRKSAFVELGFGGAASDYAQAVHEFPSKFSPPSWQGKTSLNWNAAGTGAKFLEKPVNAAKKGFGRRVARHLDLF